MVVCALDHLGAVEPFDALALTFGMVVDVADASCIPRTSYRQCSYRYRCKWKAETRRSAEGSSG
jgi:hypothetical protein